MSARNDFVIQEGLGIIIARKIYLFLLKYAIHLLGKR